MRFSISTKHKRQEPKASKESVEQSLGILIPSCAAARMIEVPRGTLISRPSIVNVTNSAVSESATDGVP